MGDCGVNPVGVKEGGLLGSQSLTTMVEGKTKPATTTTGAPTGNEHQYIPLGLP
jgi:hypothetical protein